jgi:ADP-ribose pyrophosphatase YjhB (NUDIX family)
MDIIRPGVMAFVLDSSGQKILLHRRTDNGHWSLPGGAAEFGDSVQETVKREVLEECGVDVNIRRLVGVYSDPKRMMFSYPDGNNVHSYSLIFECQAVTDVITTGDGKESLEVGWHDREFVRTNIWEKLSYIVGNYLDNSQMHIE